MAAGTKSGKEVIFGIMTGTIREKFKFYSCRLKYLSTTFSDLVPVQRSQETEEKNQKKFFLDLKKIGKFCSCIW
jgi:hypothetical protein